MSQVKKFDLTKANTQLFNKNLYCYGLAENKQSTRFCVYKLNFQTNIIDSFFLDLGKTRAEDYLQLNSDTLHNFLNIYVQKKEKKTVAVFRFSNKFELVTRIENIDIARLNSSASFESEFIYFQSAVFSIKQVTDSSGQQFYLNKSTLKSETKNFEYEFNWQYAFERKNINSAQIFYANKNHVLIYVNVIGGPKTGQWVLKINSETGKLIRGTKLNGKGETETYEFGNFLIDTLNKSFQLIGHLFTEKEIDSKINKLSISNTLFSTAFLIEIDSLGDIIAKQSFKIPINDIKTGVKKTYNTYLLHFNCLTKTSDGKISFETDVFKNSNNSACYLYSNTQLFNLVPLDEKLVLEKNSISSNLLIEKFYFNNDKLDLNGKLCIDSLTNFKNIFHKKITFPIKQQFKLDSSGNPCWILTKSNAKKNTFSYTYLMPIKKIYELVPIDEINTSLQPVFTSLSSSIFIISTQIDEHNYHLKLFNW